MSLLLMSDQDTLLTDCLEDNVLFLCFVLCVCVCLQWGGEHHCSKLFSIQLVSRHIEFRVHTVAEGISVQVSRL